MLVAFLSQICQLLESTELFEVLLPLPCHLRIETRGNVYHFVDRLLLELLNELVRAHENTVLLERLCRRGDRPQRLHVRCEEDRLEVLLLQLQLLSILQQLISAGAHIPLHEYVRVPCEHRLVRVVTVLLPLGVVRFLVPFFLLF